MLNSQQVLGQRADKICRLHLSKRARLFTSPSCHRPQRSPWGHAQHDHSLAPGSAPGEMCQTVAPQSCCPVSEMFPVNYADLPIQEPRELLPDLPLQFQLLHVCATHLWRLPASCLGTGANHRSPPTPPPQRLSEAAPCVIGISLMKKGCVSLITVTVK